MTTGIMPPRQGSSKRIRLLPETSLSAMRVAKRLHISGMIRHFAEIDNPARKARAPGKVAGGMGVAGRTCRAQGEIDHGAVRERCG